MARERHIHWLGPTNILAAFFTAVALAVGHHCFYASLTGNPVPDGEYSLGGSQLSKQQLNIAGGTALAFFFKASIALAVAASYTQLFWRVLKTSSKATRLGDVDAAFSLAQDLLSFFRTSTWQRQYLSLVPIAVIFWLIPIASIITPATLSVHSALVLPFPRHSISVPQMNWINHNFFNFGTVGTEQRRNYFIYAGPSPSVQKIVSAVNAQGRILPITPPDSNVSWSLGFWGPAIHCGETVGSDRTSILENYGGTFLKGGRSLYSYFSWAKNRLPFNNGSGVPQLDTFDPSYEASSTLFLGYDRGQGQTTLMSGDWYYTDNATILAQGGWSELLRNFTILECHLYNASYTLGFNYTNDRQEIAVTRTNISADTIVLPQHQAYFPVGRNQTWNSTIDDPKQPEAYLNVTNAMKFSYQSVYDGFLMQVIGGLGSASDYDKSSIKGTILSDTEELSFLNNPDFSTEALDSPAFVDRKDKAYRSRGQLIPVLEQLFENITVSILSDPYLQPNTSSPLSQSPQAEVSYERWRNIYIYDATTLWTAYGVAISLAALTVLAGIFAILQDGAAYDKNFSTILRKSLVRNAASATESETLFLLRDGGSMPLPKALGDLVVSLDRPSSFEAGFDTSKWRSDVRNVENIEPTSGLESVPLVSLKRGTV